MWVDLLNKPKQGAAFRRDGAMLMNCPEEYDNIVECLSTDPRLLDFEQKLVVNVIKLLPDMSKPQLQRRSVLEPNKAYSRRREVCSRRRTHGAPVA